MALGVGGDYCVQIGDGRVCSEMGMELCKFFFKSNSNIVEFVELVLGGDGW